VKRKLLLVSAGVIALLVAMSALGSQPAARADTSSMDWDVNMTDAAPTGSDPVCSSNNDGNIDVGECPEIVTSMYMDTKDATSNEPFFDLAPQIWKTGPPGADLDGDGLAEPSTGVAQISNLTIGTTVGRASFSTKNNVVIGNLASNNVDDIGGDYDTTLTGQPVVCGNPNGGTFTSTFNLWWADESNTNLVPNADTGLNNYTFGQDCSVPGGTPDPYGIPDGVDCTPAGVLVTQAVIGFPVANYVGRAFGIARLPIGSPTPITWFNTDFNYLIYNLVSVPEIQGYGAYLMLGYRVPGADPFDLSYSAIGQAIVNCTPCTYAPVRMFGITQDSDFSLPPDGVIDLVTPPEAHLKVTGDSGTTDFILMKSTNEDWDGDTIADVFDRCRIDPNSGAAAGDTDKDGLTGYCENPTGMTTCAPGSEVLPDGGIMYWNCEGNNPQQGGAWNSNPPWDTGQDVDGDGYLNTVDNCPIVADRDLIGDPAIDYQLDTDGDTVGDVCENDLHLESAGTLPGLQDDAELIPGNGQGYPGRQVGDMVQVASPGTFLDHDNVCSDPFTVGTAEATLDSGRWCAGLDAVGRPFGPTASGISALGRIVADSNDDGTPDLLDYPAGGTIEWMDRISDSDLDGHSDACEAFTGSDPLDASSVPGAPAVAGDCDNDGTGDATDADPFTGLNPDADRDGCARSEEQPGAVAPKPGSVAAGGVSFQDQAWYDFYDVPVPSLKAGAGVYSKSVTMGDVLAVLNYVGEKINPPSAAYTADANSNGIMDGVEYDRTPSYAPNPPWDAGPPNGSVTMADVLATLAQVGLKCTLGTHF
jgi:hypothetical protein